MRWVVGCDEGGPHLGPLECGLSVAVTALENAQFVSYPRHPKRFSPCGAQPQFLRPSGLASQFLIQAKKTGPKSSAEFLKAGF